MLRLKDKNKGIFTYRNTPTGAVIKKGKREVYLNFKSVSSGEKARKSIKENSFDKLFKKGKKVKVLGNNISYLKY